MCLDADLSVVRVLRSQHTRACCTSNETVSGRRRLMVKRNFFRPLLSFPLALLLRLGTNTHVLAYCGDGSLCPDVEADIADATWSGTRWPRAIAWNSDPGPGDWINRSPVFVLVFAPLGTKNKGVIAAACQLLINTLSRCASRLSEQKNCKHPYPAFHDNSLSADS